MAGDETLRAEHELRVNCADVSAARSISARAVRTSYPILDVSVNPKPETLNLNPKPST